MNDRMRHDLHQHFTKQLGVLISDTAKTCDIAGIDHGEIVQLIFSGVMYELLRCAYTLDMNKKDFLAICSVSHSHMAQTIKEANNER